MLRGIVGFVLLGFEVFVLRGGVVEGFVLQGVVEGFVLRGVVVEVGLPEKMRYRLLVVLEADISSSLLKGCSMGIGE
ncbi:hypothetical protein FRX31_027028, partial [Thalictrum thalictroides]